MAKKTRLLNQKVTRKNKSVLFEQYKIFVDSCQQISQRREASNEFYLALNTGFITVSGYLMSLSQSNIIVCLIPIFGIIANYYWYRLIISYKGLNTGKFVVIHELERYLPANLFKYEWEVLEKGKTNKYAPLTHLERNVPLLFIVIYILSLILINWNFITLIAQNIFY
ncbi:MAG: hypothetical protein PHS54_05005 [Clostridia bacterium]|nr:hypothetical protein [Clostridia bacterium]